MKTGISLITMGAGNVIVLRETLESLKTVCDEIIYGDLLLFPEDREIVHIYEREYNMKIVKFPFDYIFKNGFSACLNTLAEKASNDMVVYMNTSEVIEKDNGILKTISPEYNCYFFDHATDPHRWFRMYNRKELKWSGRIHEEVVGEHRPYHKPIFRMADLEKDMYSGFKAKVFDTVKEIVYFTQYMKLIDEPEGIGGTNEGWIKFAHENYESMRCRLLAKGKQYEAFQKGDYTMFMESIYSDQNFTKEIFESSDLVEFQNDPKYLGK